MEESEMLKLKVAYGVMLLKTTKTEDTARTLLSGTRQFNETKHTVLIGLFSSYEKASEFITDEDFVKTMGEDKATIQPIVVDL